jgi:hypothetical protein
MNVICIFLYIKKICLGIFSENKTSSLLFFLLIIFYLKKKPCCKRWMVIALIIINMAWFSKGIGETTPHPTSVSPCSPTDSCFWLKISHLFIYLFIYLLSVKNHVNLGEKWMNSPPHKLNCCSCIRLG